MCGHLALHRGSLNSEREGDKITDRFFFDFIFFFGNLEKQIWFGDPLQVGVQATEILDPLLTKTVK